MNRYTVSSQYVTGACQVPGKDMETDLTLTFTEPFQIRKAGKASQGEKKKKKKGEWAE